MFPEEVFTARRELAEKIAIAPTDYLNDNAAPLLRILWELQESLALELQVIQGIKRLDVTDLPTLRDYLGRFADYVDSRNYNLERTSCGRISRIYWSQIQIPAGHDSARVTELHDIIEKFANADSEFAIELEVAMGGALDKLRAVVDAAEAGRIDEAKEKQRQFIADYQQEVAKLKFTLRQLGDTGNALLDRL